MRLQAVPEDPQFATDRGLQRLEELEHLRRPDRAGEETE